MPSAVYGAALPPGLEASTRGELRLRVDKLILDDAALNHSPLIQYAFGSGQPLSSSTALQPAGGGSGRTATSTAVTSPNRFVVPVDHCAVCPLFWGEHTPSARCQPATPGQPSRGPITLVYPVKVSEEHFTDYLQNMTQSPHGGMQVEVYVPSSYSGRAPVPVGKSVIALDRLRAGSAMSGWFTVTHLQPGTRPALSRRPKGPRGLDADTDSTRASEEDDSASAAGSPACLVVGKVKLHVQLVFFAAQGGAAGSALSKANRLPSRAAEEPSTEHGRRPNASSSSASSRATPLSTSPLSSVHASPHDHSAHAAQHQQQHHRHLARGRRQTHPKGGRRKSHAVPVNHRHSGGSGSGSSSSSSSSVEDSEPSIEVEVTERYARTTPVQGTAARRPPARGGDRPEPVGQRETDLLSRGLLLLERMTKAADTTIEDMRSDPFRAQDARLERAGLTGQGAPSSTPPGARGERPRSDSDETLYSSECSDEERSTLRRRRERAREQHQDQQQPRTAPAARTAAIGIDMSQGSAADANGSYDVGTASATLPSAVPRAPSTGAVTMELSFSRFAFAQTPSTANLAEMRVSVRLSADITTDEPAAGPFSSYVHQLPLSQASICLCFSVRSFSETASRLVVELINVRSTSGPAPATRLVAEEELLGLCIIGVFPQSRELVLRDPVTSLHNATCHLDMSIRAAGVPRAQVSGGVQPDSGSASRWAGLTGETAKPADMSMLHTRSGSHSSSEQSSRTSTSSTAASSTDAASSTAHARLRHRSRHRRHSAARRLRAAIGAVPVARPLPRAANAPPRTVRLCVAIQRAVNLPLVAVASGSDAAAREGGAYTHPSCFFQVDAVLGRRAARADRPQSAGGLPGTDNAHDDGALSVVSPEVEGWHVDAVANGYYDRTNVVQNSQQPVFNYNCMLVVPASRDASPDDALPASTEEELEEAATEGSSAMEFGSHLDALRLCLWHVHDGSAPPRAQGTGCSVGATAPAVSAGSAEQKAELDFWSLCAYVGECVVDLRPLRYLKRLDGFYRITSPLPFGQDDDTASSDERYSSARGVRGLAGAAEPQHTVGHVHVAVWAA